MTRQGHPHHQNPRRENTRKPHENPNQKAILRSVQELLHKVGVLLVLAHAHDDPTFIMLVVEAQSAEADRQQTGGTWCNE
jgi:hypothetical protein